ncbi:MAG: GNAT family N-acetyltransferase [Oscillospiraceae bacterium]|nr:GNAT family N-acetyltransferase [Oscillospiraceae bacterium]
METCHFMPEDAMKVRILVFVEEQGFVDEFDEIDAVATHFVAYDGDHPIGTCRLFWDDIKKRYTIGRLAVVKEYRGRSLGRRLLASAEEETKKQGGEALYLHAQCRAEGFYQKAGYTSFGPVEPEEGCPHIWMVKAV